MAKTLLNAVNEVLNNTRHISGTDGALTSLTDSARQVWIDGAVTSLRDTVQELYSQTRTPLPKIMRTQPIALVEDKRSYALDNDVIKLQWPLRDEDNGEIILEHRRRLRRHPQRAIAAGSVRRSAIFRRPGAVAP